MIAKLTAIILIAFFLAWIQLEHKALRRNKKRST